MKCKLIGLGIRLYFFDNFGLCLPPPRLGLSLRRYQYKSLRMSTRKRSLDSGPSRKRKASSARPGEAVYCLCRGGDDGRPMVYCSQCDDWFHFECVQLSEEDAADINVYFCPSCTETTQRRTTSEFHCPPFLSYVESSYVPLYLRCELDRRPCRAYMRGTAPRSALWQQLRICVHRRADVRCRTKDIIWCLSRPIHVSYLLLRRCALKREP